MTSSRRSSTAATDPSPRNVSGTDAVASGAGSLSVVIPAHNEAAVIERCLTSILRDARPGEFEIVVAANGCTDHTVDIARRVAPEATVLDLPEASKVVALNAADQVASRFPRAYVDADVEVDAASLRTSAAALAHDRVECVAPTMHVQMEGRSWVIRRFYECFLQLPYLADDLVGQGFYMLSSEGRARFDRFPDITADDLFVRNIVPPRARRSVAGATFRMHPPRTVRGLLAIRRRAYRGNAEYAHRGYRSSEQRTADVRRFVEQLRTRPASFAVYAVINAIARVHVRLRRRPTTWERDDSSRW